MLKAVTQTILTQLPEQTKLRSEDIEVIRSQKDFLFSIADYIVTDFYDTVFSNEETAKVFIQVKE